jgi:hypothetical protein
LKRCHHNPDYTNVRSFAAPGEANKSIVRRTR